MKIKDTEKKQTKKGTAVSRSKILSKKETTQQKNKFQIKNQKQQKPKNQKIISMKKEIKINEKEGRTRNRFWAYNVNFNYDSNNGFSFC